MLSLCVYYDLYGVNANWEYRRHYVDKLVPDSPPIHLVMAQIIIPTFPCF